MPTECECNTAEGKKLLNRQPLCSGKLGTLYAVRIVMCKVAGPKVKSKLSGW